jgi:hypothetical protein
MASQEKSLEKELEPKMERNNGNNLHDLVTLSASRRIVTSDCSQKMEKDHCDSAKLLRNRCVQQLSRSGDADAQLEFGICQRTVKGISRDYYVLSVH